MKDYYKILGVKATASPEDIHARWIELMRKFHPDRRRKGEAEDKRIKEINEAYDVLKHSSERSHYDLQRTYYQKKRTLHLQRFILPPIVLLVLLFFGLIYFQGPNVTPPPQSQVPSVRRFIQINPTNQINAVNDTNDLNDLKAPGAPNDLHPTDQINRINETNQIDQPNRTNQINRANPRKPTHRGAKVKKPLKVQKSTPSTNQLNEINQINQKDETNQTNEINQNNPANRTSASKDRKVPLVFAKAKRPPKVQKLASSPKQLNKTNQINQTNEIDQIDETGQMDQTNEINESKQINQINEPKFVTALDVSNESNDPNALNDPNEPNHLSQLTPSSLIATEEEVKDFFALYRLRYNRKDIDALLSLFSPRAVQNQRDEFDEIKKIYSDFFNQSKELRYHMKDTSIEIFQNAVQVKARYEIDQIRKHGREKKVWRGEIRWILVKENRALKIRFLDFRPQESR